MKRILLSTIFVFIAIIGFSQTIVVTTPQERNVVLEEFTGIHCGYCPQGHVIAETMLTNNPNRVVVVNVHAGSYANPNAGEPDFRTVYGDQLVGEMGVTGFPSGAVNRHKFAGEPNIATGRGAWTDDAAEIFPQQSPVNIGFTTSFDSVSRQLTIDIEAYYTLNSDSSENYIHVAFLQNHVHGYQSDYTNGTQTNYDHKHILREFLTGQWGDTITTTTQGSLYTKQYVYTVPGNFNGDTVLIDDCDIAVYISETKSEIYTGSVSRIDTTNNGSTSLYIGTLSAANEVLSGSATNTTVFTTNAVSSLSGSEDFIFTLTSNAPAGWVSSFDINSTNYATTATISLNNGTNNAVTINVTPDNTAAVAKYTLTMTSVTNPTAPAKVIELYVVSGITDLIVNGSGSWGDGNSYDWESVYVNGLAQANCSTFAAVDANIMLKGFNDTAFTVLNSIYMNIAWTFPSMSDDEATALMNFMDNGGNVFVAGQDIGWDINDASGYGTAVTENLYTNYLHAAFADDGSTANNNMNAISTDVIFNNISSSSVIDVYGGNMYPDQINPLGAATAIFQYNSSSTKTAGIRYYEGNYKVVYIGVGMEMLQDTTVKNSILKTSYDWFNGILLDGYITSSQNVNCHGSNNGTATVTPEGGTPPYSYLWSDNQVDSTAIDLVAGTYQVSVIDANTDTIIILTTITEPNLISITNSHVDASCDTCVDGTATVIATEGSGTYTYLWNDVLAQTTSTANSLITGIYVVIVTDSLCGDQVSDTIQVGYNIGINDYNNLPNLILYPNPTNDIVNFNFNINNDYIITDIAGKVVKSGYAKNSISIGELNTGLYFVKIAGNNKAYKLFKN